MRMGGGGPEPRPPPQPGRALLEGEPGEGPADGAGVRRAGSCVGEMRSKYSMELVVVIGSPCVL